MPTLSDGRQVVAGRIDGDGWRVYALSLSLPRLHPDQRVRGRAGGRVTSGELAVHLDLAVAMTQPANDAGIANVGPLAASSGHWRLPPRLHLSAPPHFRDARTPSPPLHPPTARPPPSGNHHPPPP